VQLPLLVAEAARLARGVFPSGFDFKSIEEAIAMQNPEQCERGGMPLWAVAASLIFAWLSCVTFVSRVVFVFSDYQWTDHCLEWISYVMLALSPLSLMLGFAVSWRQRGSL
jgi:hypothetical protein